MPGPTIDAVKEMNKVEMTVQIQRNREAKIRTWLGFRLLRLARWVTGWDLRIVDLHSPGDEAARANRRRAKKRNEKLRETR